MPAKGGAANQSCLQALAFPQDAGAAAKSAVLGSEAPQKVLQLEEGRFVDFRWTDGRWDLTKFASAGGKMDWEAWNKVLPWLSRAPRCEGWDCVSK